MATINWRGKAYSFAIAWPLILFLYLLLFFFLFGHPFFDSREKDDLHAIDANVAMPLLFIMLGVTVAAFLMHSRTVFVLGFIGCVLSLSFHEMGHSFGCGLTCAIGVVLAGLAIRRLFAPPRQPVEPS